MIYYTTLHYTILYYTILVRIVKRWVDTSGQLVSVERSACGFAEKLPTHALMIASVSTQGQSRDRERERERERRFGTTQGVKLSVTHSPRRPVLLIRGNTLNVLSPLRQFENYCVRLGAAYDDVFTCYG